MEVTFINADNRQVPQIFECFSDDSLDQAYIVHDVKEADIRLLTDFLETRTSLDSKLSTGGRELIESRHVYILPQPHKFAYDGRYLSLIPTDAGASSDRLSEAELLDILAHNYPHGTLTLLDKNLRIIYTAGEDYLLYSVDPRDLRGKLAGEVLIPGIYDGLMDAIKKSEDVEFSTDFEVVYQQSVYQNTCMMVRRDNDNHPYYLLKSVDISGKQMAISAFQESEVRYRQILKMSREIVCIHDAEGTYKFVSPASYNLLGFKSEELIGKSPFDYLHPEDVDYSAESFVNAIESGRANSNVQYRFRKKDGSYIWLDSYTDVVTKPDGSVDFFISGSRDITELKNVEIKLRESDERFRGIADNIPGVIYLCMNDPSFSMIYLNSEVENLTGYTPEDFLNSRVSLASLFHPDDRDEIFSKVNYALEHHEAFHLTYRLKRKGSYAWVWVEEHGQGIYENGQLKWLEGVILDISERKIAEAKLNERDANLKAIFESTTSIIGLFDSSKRLIEYNRAFQDYAKANEGIDLYRGIDIIDRIAEPLAGMFRDRQERALQGHKFSETIEYPVPHGILHLLINYHPIYQKGKVTGVSVFIEDITTLKESQKMLEEYAENLEQLVEQRTQELKEKNDALYKGNCELEYTLNHLKSTQEQLVQAEKMASLGVLAAGIGHEINNPLNFIKNGCSALLQNIMDEPYYNEEELKPLFEIIDDGVNRASEIVKSLGHFSRQVKNADEKCNIHGIIDNCLVILNSRLKGRVDVVKNYADRDLQVTANEGRLHQAFLNILANAEQAIEDQGRIEIYTTENQDNITIEISDSGVGIPEEHISKIGDPFFTTKEPGRGTGLGLFITYSIIKEFGGEIKVSSERKKGSKFSIVLRNS